MKKAFLIVFLVLWFGNYHVSSYFYDPSDYYQYGNFIAMKDAIYEVMFLLLATLCFLQCSGFSKALACFAVILILGSIVDKLVFGETGYMVADIMLVLVGLAVSVIVYRNERRISMDHRDPKLDI